MEHGDAMPNKTDWNVQPAQSQEDLRNILFSAAAGLKTQVIASPILASSPLANLRDRLSAIADELHGLQQDVVCSQRDV